MNLKLIAMGNVLMKDDGIGIFIAKKLVKELVMLGIEIILGETDVGYCTFSVSKGDYLFLLDASCFGKLPGTITVYSFSEYPVWKKEYAHHDCSMLDMLKVCNPDIKGMIIAIEISEVDFGFGLSPVLEEKLAELSKTILDQIKATVLGLKTIND